MEVLDAMKGCLSQLLGALDGDAVHLIDDQLIVFWVTGMQDHLWPLLPALHDYISRTTG
jgi:hypothetical protein